MSHSFEGIQLVEQAPFGKVLIATREFAQYEEVFREVPFLMYKDELDLVTKYSKMSESSQTKMMTDFFHLNHPSESRFEECKEVLSQLAALCDFLASQKEFSISPQKIFELLSISHFNSHAFIGQEEYTTTTENNSKTKALFLLGSKVCHSCSPNMLYTSKVVPGHMMYMAIKPIAVGDMLTFDYGMNRSTFERRKTLINTKDFFCQCLKCMSPDYSRPLKCPERNCSGYTCCTVLAHEASEQWECRSCGQTAPPTVEAETRERTIESSLNSFINRIRMVSQDLLLSLKQLDALMAESLQSLGPTHHLISRCLEESSTLNASVLAQLTNNSHINIMKKEQYISMHRLASIDKGLASVKVTECVSAGCLNGVSCCISHPPSSGNIHQVFWAAMDWLNIPSRKGDVYIPVFKKYLPLLRCTFGQMDKDMMKIEQKLMAMDDDNKVRVEKIEQNPMAMDAETKAAQELLAMLLLEEENSKQRKGINKKSSKKGKQKKNR